MTREPVRISVDRDVRDVMSLMHTHHVRRIPIMDSLETVLGIVTMDDLIALLGNEISEMGEHGLGTLALSRQTAHPSLRSDHLRRAEHDQGVRWR